jgi:hypothetical protein
MVRSFIIHSYMHRDGYKALRGDDQLNQSKCIYVGIKII